MQNTWIELKINLTTEECSKLKTLAARSNKDIGALVHEILSRSLHPIDEKNLIPSRET